MLATVRMVSELQCTALLQQTTNTQVTRANTAVRVDRGLCAVGDN